MTLSLQWNVSSTVRFILPLIRYLYLSAYSQLGVSVKRDNSKSNHKEDAKKVLLMFSPSFYRLYSLSQEAQDIPTLRLMSSLYEAKQWQRSVTYSGARVVF